jgi:TetR/AcrR family transcriptional regulator, transcriptional repressor for nem operon
MSDSPSATNPGKRDRLVTSAAELIHHVGVQGMTLAQVAEAADVPLGNVYYYFKTRDDLVRAVVDAHRRAIDNLLADLDERTTPAARLKGLVHNWTDVADDIAAWGCPISGISAELAKRGDDLGDCAATLLQPIVSWAASQFRELGRPNAAAEARSLVASVQGAAVLANVFSDPKVLIQEKRRIERTIDEVARTS